MADDVHLRPVGPDGQLVGGGGAEGIPRSQQDPVALVLQEIRQLADGGGLAHAVDADHQDHGGLVRQVQVRGPHVQHLHQDLPQAGLDLLRLLDLVGLHPLPQGLHGLQGRVHAHVGEDEVFLQLLKKIFVHGEEAGEDVQLFDLIKQSHGKCLLLSMFRPQQPLGLVQVQPEHPADPLPLHGHAV